MTYIESETIEPKTELMRDICKEIAALPTVTAGCRMLTLRMTDR